nr:MAG TPA: hypothetical protein [Caudoviricetes sp.]DAJ92087.1 MAG TPA: hypothetical protein [Caudoviricetes sp.]
MTFGAIYSIIHNVKRQRKQTERLKYLKRGILL